MSLTTDYKITAFDTTLGRITIQFDCVDYSIDLDLHLDENGYYPEGENLDNYIRTICPVWSVHRAGKIDAGVPNVDSVLSLVQEPAPVEVVEEPEPEPEPIAEDQYLTPEAALEMQISIIVQKMVAEMFGSTV